MFYVFELWTLNAFHFTYLVCENCRKLRIKRVENRRPADRIHNEKYKYIVVHTETFWFYSVALKKRINSVSRFCPTFPSSSLCRSTRLSDHDWFHLTWPANERISRPCYSKCHPTMVKLCCAFVVCHLDKKKRSKSHSSSHNSKAIAFKINNIKWMVINVKRDSLCEWK